MDVGNSHVGYAPEERAAELVDWYLEDELIDPPTADRVTDLRDDAGPMAALRLILGERGRRGGRRRT